MSKTINHEISPQNGVCLLQRKYLGSGRFYQRGLFKGVEIADLFVSFTAPDLSLRVDKIISIKDSNANNLSKEQKKDAYTEVELVYDGFKNEETFTVRPNNFGN